MTRSLRAPTRAAVAAVFVIAIVACRPEDGAGPAPDDAGGGEASLVEMGARYVEARGCPECHQSPNRADGILSGQTTPRPGTGAYPANLTPDPDTGVDSWSDDSYLRAIREGKDDQGQPLCGTMPRFTNVTDAEGKAIAAYLRSLAPVWRPIPPSTCPPIKPPPADAGADAAAAADAASADAAASVDAAADAR